MQEEDFEKVEKSLTCYIISQVYRLEGDSGKEELK